jgi:hypothetical protein
MEWKRGILFLTTGLDGFLVACQNPLYHFVVLSCWAMGRAFRIIPYNPLHPADDRVCMVTFVKLKHRSLNEALREMNTSNIPRACYTVTWKNRAAREAKLHWNVAFKPSQQVKS